MDFGITLTIGIMSSKSWVFWFYFYLLVLKSDQRRLKIFTLNLKLNLTSPTLLGANVYEKFHKWQYCTWNPKYKRIWTTLDS